MLCAEIEKYHQMGFLFLHFVFSTKTSQCFSRKPSPVPPLQVRLSILITHFIEDKNIYFFLLSKTRVTLKYKYKKNEKINKQQIVGAKSISTYFFTE